MSNYSKSTNFATKDNLTPGDPLKIVRGTEIDTEFNNIATAIATKTDNASAAITGGTINDTTIGATTASTGAFTTLAASGNVTLSGGTANGVTYLNGSKVVTSGSALTFDGTKLSLPTTLAIKGAQNSNNAKIAMTRTDQSWSINNETDLRFYGQNTDTESPSSIAHSMGNTGTFVWNNANTATEQMRLTSTGLGIGTSSPSYKLDVAGAARSDSWIGRTNGSAPTADCAMYRPADNSLGFSTANIERMRIDSSGNLGIGTSSIPTVGSTTVLAVGNANGGTHAIVQSGSIVYRTSASTSSVDFYTGNAVPLIFYTSGSERARIDSSGNFLVGTTSFSYNPTQGATISGGSVGAIGIGHASGTVDGNGYLNFAYNGTNIGSVTQNSTTSVAYNTSSDYRLKNITGPITNSGAYIDSLNPVEGTWKADGSTFVGLIAHEVQEASRTPVATGTKDGAEMQAMDYSNSELIANLIAEVKSLRKRLADAGL